jgi:hypothetical protein
MVARIELPDVRRSAALAEDAVGRLVDHQAVATLAVVALEKLREVDRRSLNVLVAQVLPVDPELRVGHRRLPTQSGLIKGVSSASFMVRAGACHAGSPAGKRAFLAPDTGHHIGSPVPSGHARKLEIYSALIATKGGGRSNWKSARTQTAQRRRRASF